MSKYTKKRGIGKDLRGFICLQRASRRLWCLRKQGIREYLNWRMRGRTIGLDGSGRPSLPPGGPIRHRDGKSFGLGLWAALMACQGDSMAGHSAETRRNPGFPLSAGQNNWSHVESCPQRYMMLVPKCCRDGILVPIRNGWNGRMDYALLSA